MINSFVIKYINITTQKKNTYFTREIIQKINFSRYVSSNIS